MNVASTMRGSGIVHDPAQFSTPRGQSWFRVVLTIVLLAPHQAACGIEATPSHTVRPLRVVLQVRPEACYPGQTVELWVGVVAENERPRVTPPNVPGVEMTYVGVDLKPLSAGGIGDLVSVRNLFRFHYRLIPRRAGALTVPPITARLGARQGASTPVTLPAGTPVSPEPLPWMTPVR